MDPAHRILLVEDSAAVRKAIAQLLEESGYAPVEAESAEVALELARAGAPDLVITDHFLPGMTGAELARQLRTSPALEAVPVVGLSARNGTERALLAAGACCFVVKPFEPEELLRAVRWALSVYRAAASGEE